jgi:hypothetical protein
VGQRTGLSPLDIQVIAQLYTGVAPEIRVSQPFSFLNDTGNFSLTGTISLPSGTAAGLLMGVVVTRIDQPESYQQSAGYTTGSTTIAFSVEGLAAGQYRIEARTDVNGNGLFGDPGDLDGSSETIPITNQAVSGVTFSEETIP